MIIGAWTHSCRRCVIIGHAISTPIKGSCCFLEQETLPSLLSTGGFQERIRTWFHNQTKINWGRYGRLTWMLSSKPKTKHIVERWNSNVLLSKPINIKTSSLSKQLIVSNKQCNLEIAQNQHASNSSFWL